MTIIERPVNHPGNPIVHYILSNNPSYNHAPCFTLLNLSNEVSPGAGDQAGDSCQRHGQPTPPRLSVHKYPRIMGCNLRVIFHLIKGCSWKGQQITCGTCLVTLPGWVPRVGWGADGWGGGVQMSGKTSHQKGTLFNTQVSEGVTSQDITRRLSRFWQSAWMLIATSLVCNFLWSNY